MSTDHESSNSIEHLDVLIVGAGLSGIGAGRYLKVEHPSKSFAILEARAASGGTWDLFRYPGIRSDSDMTTLGYDFKPWTNRQSIADGSKIRDYVRETATENGLDEHIRYQRKVVSADWSSDNARWQIELEHTDSGKRSTITAGWIYCAGGYYRYDEGFTPEFEGRDRFTGQIIHPQHWPEDLDYTGKKVVVIGSGATAVTLVPSMAGTAEHVTMLQRTPTYIMPLPKEDIVATTAQRLFGAKRGYAIARRKNIEVQRAFFQFCQRFPTAARLLIRQINARLLPSDFPMDPHFNPPYNPWDQRLCAVPDGDLFKALGRGTASIVTDRIKTFTENGILLESGQELEADIIVTATGLNLQMMGGMDLSVDGRTVSFSDTVAYRGMMLSGIPNFAMAVGYTNSSWTLKLGLVNEYFCRLIAHMDSAGYDTVWAAADPDMETRPLLDFGAGYVQRSLAGLPKQGTEAPWLMSMSYAADVKTLREGSVTDDNMRFSSPNQRASARKVVLAGAR